MAKVENDEMEKYGNFLKNGTFCLIETHAWGNTKKIPEEKLKKITKNKELSKWVRANKGLIDKEALEDINSNIGRFRNIFKSRALPSPFTSIYVIPNDEIVEISEEADNIINDVKKAVKKFVPKYTQHIESAKEELGPNLFNPDDYPKDIENRFSCSYRFIKLSVPGELKTISSAMYKEEMIKFKETMEQTRNECILFLREAFLKELKGIIESLTRETNDGKVAKIRSETVEKVENFFEAFKSKNIFEDEKLLTIIEDARNVMCGVTSKDLRNSDALRSMITNQIKQVADICEKSIVKYKRKISL